ncbi:PspC domain-containing protein [Geodermatophilus sabuli]|uniref:Phage shock protein C (PspC) family protein n=1 Tax=Geodermatophilus sabuli TaxID=1564158 RepID=A0A285E9T1_9ACTN|nr:PspC domain-containing protein [Geodermatophilus sabuli]MBB3084862.1 phage shock protein PspC (stress-responsive transcriptional regulator) [Geodermatophilus sabuli]SNX95730.1 phage shock protein C (PspC) family protein [Geodermatophilus sabuli]
MTSAPPPPPIPPAPPPFDPPAAEYPPPGPPVRPPLRRSRTDKVIGGVSGGLAEYTGIDALLWRVGFVALALAGPGIPVYLLLWLFMSAGPRDDAVAARVKAPAEPRSPIPGTTLAGLLIVAGTLVLISRFTDWSIGPRWILGSALLVVGLGLVAAAFTGGRRAKGGLIALGAVLSLALIAVANEPWHNVDGGIGDRTYRPATAEDVRAEYHLGMGDAVLDLTDVDLAGLDGPITTRIDAGVGDVDVLVPRSADVRVSVDSGLGNVDVFDGSAVEGFHRGLGSAGWTGDDEPEIVLTINAGIGDVEVSRA